MKHALLFFSIALTCIGCGTGTAPEAEIVIPKIPVTGLQTGDYPMPGKFGLSNGKKVVRIGDSRDSFELIFPRPSRGFPLEPMIPGLPKEFKSEGWETTSQGAGVISDYNTILLLMQQYEALNTEEFADVLRLAQAACGNVQYSYKEDTNIDYYYAISGTEVSVISRLRSPKKTYQVTVAAGDLTLMKFLGLAKPFMTGEPKIAK